MWFGRITKHDKKIKDVEKALITSISMEPFTNYKGIELYQLYRGSYYIKKLLTIRREDTFTLQPAKENYWKNALYKEETLNLSYEKYVNTIQTNGLLTCVKTLRCRTVAYVFVTTHVA